MTIISPSLPTPSNSFGKRHIFAVLFVVVVYILGQHPRDNPLTPIRDPERSTDPLLIAAPNPLFCQDDDDDDDDFVVTHCSCRDPTVAYMYKRQLWRAHHQRMKQVAAAAPSQLDVVFLGDSILERLNGTRMNGHQPAYFANKRVVFDQYFQTERMKGLILGSSGDTTGHFLWHLQNGLLPESLQPKAFVILLGTNNMGRDGCNKRTTLAGILQVIHVVHRQKPDAMILVHGLLPCSDQKPFRGPDYNELENRFTLGRQWKNSLWINAELKKTCDLMRFCAYMDSGDVFLTPDGKIQDDRMVDSMHPSLEGYKMWVPRIAGRLELLLKKVANESEMISMATRQV